MNWPCLGGTADRVFVLLIVLILLITERLEQQATAQSAAPQDMSGADRIQMDVFSVTACHRRWKQWRPFLIVLSVKGNRFVW